LNVVANEKVELAVAVVVEPCGARPESVIADRGFLRHIAKVPAAIVVKQVVPIERSEIDVILAVVIVVADRYAHSVDFDIKTTPMRDIRKRAIAVIAVESCSCSTPFRHEVPPVHEENVGAAIAIGIEEGHAGTHRFGQPLLTGAACVVSEMNAGGGCYVGETDAGVRVTGRRENSPENEQGEHRGGCNGRESAVFHWP